MMSDTAKHFTGRSHTWEGGPLSQAKLDKVLSAGKPVLMAVGPPHGGGGHVLSLGGCGGGSYYMNDPMQGSYQTVSYDRLLSRGGGGWVWLDSMFAA